MTGKKAVVAVNHPFEPSALAGAFDDGRVNAWLAALPTHLVTTRLKQRGVIRRRPRDPLLTIMKYITVTRVARRIPIQWGAATDVTFRVAMSGKES
jgi:hypothetical protein